MRISTKGGGIIKAQQGTIARPNPKENYKLPEDQRYQAQTRGMKDFAIEWYKERAKQVNDALESIGGGFRPWF